MLGQILKSLRKSRGTKVAQMAEYMGISDKQLHFIERNSSAYSEKKLAKHIQALNMRLELHFIDANDVRNVVVYEVKRDQDDKI